MIGRRGISPLIATILLIAFAVALGSLVYSYIVIFSGGTSTGCSGWVGIESVLKTDAGEPAYRLNDGEIILDLRNSGATPISSVGITYVGTEENLDSGPQRANLQVRQVDKFYQDYDRSFLGTVQTILVTPYYVQAGEEVVCNEATIEIDDLLSR